MNENARRMTKEESDFIDRHGLFKKITGVEISPAEYQKIEKCFVNGTMIQLENKIRLKTV